MSGQLLVVSIAGRRVAIPTAQILSVIELENIIPVPRAPDRVAGLTALRSRVLTVIDCMRIVEGVAGKAASRLGTAVVVDIDDHGYALMVDNVEDVTTAIGELGEIKADLGPAWSGHVLGIAETEIGPLLVIDPGRFVAGSPRGLDRAAAA
jgi:purine-binding chemotaxis protein CheW